MDNIITTRLATLKKVKFYKIDPMDIIHDKEYDHFHHKHKELLVYDFRPETWGVKRDNSDLFAVGYVELWEIQDLSSLNASTDTEQLKEKPTNDNDDNEEEEDASIRCELRLFSNSGEQWGVCKYRQLKYKGMNVKSVRHKDYLFSIARLIPQHYLIILSYDNEAQNKHYNWAMGMKMNDFYDDLRLQSNLFDFVERKEKLKNFQANFAKDSIKMSKTSDESGSYDIDAEDTDKFTLNSDEDGESGNDMKGERFDIDEDGSSDDSEFGEFLSA